MFQILKQYFIYSIAVIIFTMLSVGPVMASDVCISEEDTVDIITLLDASERDLMLLDNCTELVDRLYDELKRKDIKIASLTQELIDARQDVLRYKAQNKMLKKVTWYAVGISTIIIVVELLPAFL